MSLLQQYELDKLRQHDQLCQAKRDQLVHIATKHPQRRQLTRLAKIYQPTLYRLGQRLESIGMTLQVRYGDLKPKPLKR